MSADQPIRVNVADYAVSAVAPIVTIGLGSCVAIALYDAAARVAGLAHVLLPDESLARDRTNPAKFPATAVPLLLREMAKLGADPSRVSAKIVGGASMFGALIGSGGINIGERNVAAVRNALAAAAVPVVADDTGSDYGRSVYFYTEDGRVEVKSIRRGCRVI